MATDPTPTDPSPADVVERLRKRAEEERVIQRNNEAVAAALAPQEEAFNRRDGSHNTFAFRLMLDHRNAAKHDAELAADWDEAADLIASLTARAEKAEAEAARVCTRRVELPGQFYSDLREAATAIRHQSTGVTEEKLFKAMQDECWDLRCIACPIADTGDADVEWVVIAHHMAKPQEREVGRGSTPQAALAAAMLAARPTPPGPDLGTLIAESKARVAAMTPGELEAMHQAQRESFARSAAPCEHGVVDWENCPDCRPTPPAAEEV